MLIFNPKTRISGNKISTGEVESCRVESMIEIPIATTDEELVPLKFKLKQEHTNKLNEEYLKSICEFYKKNTSCIKDIKIYTENRIGDLELFYYFDDYLHSDVELGPIKHRVLAYFTIIAFVIE